MTDTRSVVAAANQAVSAANAEARYWRTVAVRQLDPAERARYDFQRLTAQERDLRRVIHILNTALNDARKAKP